MAFNFEKISSGMTPYCKILLYGVQGIGKTTFFERISQAFKNNGLDIKDALMIRTETGQSYCAGVDIDTYDELVGFLQSVIDNPADVAERYHFLGVDTITAVEKMVHAKALQEHPRTLNVEETFGGFGKWQTGERDRYWAPLLDMFDQVSKRTGMHVVFIAHSKIEKMTPPGMDVFNKYSISLDNPRVADYFFQYVDIAGFANYEIFTNTVIDGKAHTKDAERAQKVIKGALPRVLYLEEQGAHYAKNRYELPSQIPFDANTFAAAMLQSQKFRFAAGLPALTEADQQQQ